MMDFAYKAALTAAAVAAVLMAARLFGAQIAGLVTGLPIITAPTLVWVAVDQGRFAAISVAVGSVAACCVAALFALCYERLARKTGPLACLVTATVVAGLVCFVARALFNGLFLAFTVSMTTCYLVLRSFPRKNATATQSGECRRGNLLFTVAFAALTSPLSTLGQVDPFLVGLLAGLPVVAATVVATEHICSGPVAVTHFLRGYVGGLVGKAAFGVVFALLLIPLGWGWALLAATVASVLICVLGIGRTIEIEPTHALAPQLPTVAPDAGASLPS